MKNVCWALIFLGVLAFVVGTVHAFAQKVFLLAPQGYWRGAMAFFVLAIALRMMEEPKK